MTAVTLSVSDTGNETPLGLILLNDDSLKGHGGYIDLRLSTVIS